MAKDVNKEYYSFLCEGKGISIMQPPEVDVFAYQELNKITGKPQNDKNIFSSITTLMKAQSYEIGALEKRTNVKSIYQFNLISVIESDLVRIHIVNNELSQQDIETEQLVARYIIGKKEQFFRIRFIKAEAFSKHLKDYNLCTN
ncbi:MAG: hypothetical protein IPI65_07235 [Bacteroidetes bacterium]|nr:hypothetical protein [Bacteroidota bacterium]